MDLVRAFGVPHIDERNHGMHRERDALALPRCTRRPCRRCSASCCSALVTCGTAICGRRGPRSTGATPAPTLDAFVDSLAQLYARTGDYARVAERYRQLTAARLRRHFGLPVETPLETLLDRLRAQPSLGAGAEPGGARDAARRGERRSPRRVRARARHVGGGGHPMNGPALETVADVGGAYARLHEALAAVLVGQEGPLRLGFITLLCSRAQPASRACRGSARR